jgi:hypothetical protein
MSAASWIFFAVCATTALLVVLYLYRRRETPGRGRALLAGLRGAALVLILLVLFDPRLPAGPQLGGGRGAHVLLDGSLSMTLPGPDEATRWSRAVAQARSAAGSRTVLVFGDGVRAVPPDSLVALEPDATASRLLPALQAAAEAGVRRVVVVTDGGVEDAAEVSRWLPRLGLDVDYRSVGAPARDRSLAEVEAPAWAKAGEPVEIRFGIAASGAQGDSVLVSVLREGEVVGRTTVAAPADGRIAAGAVRFTPRATDGTERFDVTIAGGDAAPDNDVRPVYMHVSDDPAGVVLVSLAPDWEPRFLLSVLGRALGLPVTGFLRAGPTGFVRTGAAQGAGEVVDTDVVRAAVERADLLVVHAYRDGAPAWLTAAVGAAPRVLVFPSSATTELPFALELDQAISDDWYLVDDVPASPVAPLLADLQLADVPPLTAVHRVYPEQTVWSALDASRGRRGTPAPLAIGGTDGGRRWILALGQGYWRWSFRGGEPRRVYERLWSALAGWLVQEQGAVSIDAVRPVRRIVPRGEQPVWSLPGLAADSMAVHLTGTDGVTVLDTVISVTGDSVASPVVPPGSYVYRVRAVGGEGTIAEAEGEISVERWSPELARPALPLEQLEAAAVPVGPGARSRSGRPLHATPWPYAVIITLIAIEWVLRRRWGLR